MYRYTENPEHYFKTVIPTRMIIKNGSLTMIRLLSVIKTNWIIITLATLAAITFLSLWPLEKLPSVPGTDKIHHVVAYLFLMLPTALRKPKYWMVFGLLFIAYSGAIELLQPYVNRYGEWKDLFANVLGLICGIFIAGLINFYIPGDPENSSREY